MLERPSFASSFQKKWQGLPPNALRSHLQAVMSFSERRPCSYRPRGSEDDPLWFQPSSGRGSPLHRDQASETAFARLGEIGKQARHALVKTEQPSRHAPLSSPQTSQDLPVPVEPTMTR